MRGFCAGGAGQGVASAQSKSDGHCTLNENGIVLRRGSKLAGGVSLPGPLTTCKVYCEKSPEYFVERREPVDEANQNTRRQHNRDRGPFDVDGLDAFAAVDDEVVFGERRH